MKFTIDRKGNLKYNKVLTARVNFIMEEFAEDFVHNLVVNTPVDTGRLRAGYQLDGTDDSVEVTNDVEYLDYVNDGTVNQKGQHFIEKSYAQSLNKLNTIAEESQRIN